MSLLPWQQGKDNLIHHFDTEKVDDEQQGGKEAFGKIVEDGDNTAPCNDTRDELNGSLALHTKISIEHRKHRGNTEKQSGPSPRNGGGKQQTTLVGALPEHLLQDLQPGGIIIDDQNPKAGREGFGCSRGGQWVPHRRPSRAGKRVAVLVPKRAQKGEAFCNEYWRLSEKVPSPNATTGGEPFSSKIKELDMLVRLKEQVQNSSRICTKKAGQKDTTLLVSSINPLQHSLTGLVIPVKVNHEIDGRSGSQV
ncbi:hypothetical protein MUK42_16104 [Musa troglodytarum]|uniref:Uncharacterized protein n=1 Tax=Musa troglodytarum TaxID=320322 RepID=A0A9E7HED0_9LILI|nr:hypothetical protein MUK42_16104 [Musa troglodytarum]